MAKRIFITFFYVFLFISAAYSRPMQQVILPNISGMEPIKKEDRILILAPHPDDEAIGCASIIQEAVKAGAELRVVYLTNGDNNQFAFIVYEKRITFRKGEFIHMGEVRMKEAIKAMEYLGVDRKNLMFLGYPDFGTFAIFTKYWRQGDVYRSMLTRVNSVPYKNNLSFGAPYQGESILNDIKGILLNYKPTKIFVSHPADVNGDHKAFYLFLQVALADLRNDIPPAKIYPYLIHFAGWPTPRHYHPSLALLPPSRLAESRIKWRSLQMTQEQIEQKRQAILCYNSQTQCCAFYLLSFARKNELFGDYPPINFSLAARMADKLSQKEKTAIERFSAFFDFINILNKEADSHNDLDGLYTLPASFGLAGYGIEGGNLVVRIDRGRNTGWNFGVLVYLFGYNYKTPFKDMPKAIIIARNNKLKVFDGKRRIKSSAVALEMGKKRIVIKVPLVMLGDPDFILASIKPYSGLLPMDAVGWRRINVK